MGAASWYPAPDHAGSSPQGEYPYGRSLTGCRIQGCRTNAAASRTLNL